ncbi:MAG: hypothetical protein H0V80_03500 [Acidobacteria bacterium]|nr:hypothetical protein [Acidobacteriota bacterium]
MPGSALIAGAAGAVALTTVHQLGCRAFADAPRMDVLGMRAMVRLRRAAGIEVPDHATLYRQTLAGDLLSNAAYYSLVGIGSREGRWARGAALGVAAGIGALVLPRRLGLGDPPASGSVRNRWLTIAWYAIGGLTTAAVLQALDGPDD